MKTPQNSAPSTRLRYELILNQMRQVRAALDTAPLLPLLVGSKGPPPACSVGACRLHRPGCGRLSDKSCISGQTAFQGCAHGALNIAQFLFRRRNLAEPFDHSFRQLPGRLRLVGQENSAQDLAHR